MVALDGDVNPLFSEKLKKYWERDIVQFVPFKEFKNDPVELAKEILKEVPDQMTSYFQSNGIKPNSNKYADRQEAKSKVSYSEENEFFAERKSKMFNTLVEEHGLDEKATKKLLFRRGIPDEDDSWGLSFCP
jgi:hypothetical protein